MSKKNQNTFSFLPLTIRMETVGGIATPLVLRGTPLPTKRSETFSTASDNQSSVKVSLFIGERPLTKDNLFLGEFYLNGIPPSPKATPQILIEFSVDQVCLVTARATIKGSELFSEQMFSPIQNLTEDYIAKVLSDAELSRESDDESVRKIEAVNRANTLIAKAEEKLKISSNSKLSEAIAALGLALASGDSESIREKSDLLDEALTPNINDLFASFNNIFATTTKQNQNSTTPAKTKSIPKRKTPVKQGIASTQSTHSLGKIFGGGVFTLDPQLCFVLMPFAEKFQPLYEDQIKPAIEKAGLRSERADEIQGTSLITWDIWEKINRSRFIIAELTDQNPNVFYELGLAHALSKDVILLTQSMDFVPFDLKVLRCILYEFTPRGIQKLEKNLAATITALMKIG